MEGGEEAGDAGQVDPAARHAQADERAGGGGGQAFGEGQVGGRARRHDGAEGPGAVADDWRRAGGVRVGCLVVLPAGPGFAERGCVLVSRPVLAEVGFSEYRPERDGWWPERCTKWP